MNGKQESRNKMLMNVQIYLSDNPKITSTLPDYDIFAANLASACKDIKAYSEINQQSTKGVTDVKKQLKKGLVKTTADASRKMQAYAKLTENVLLLSDVKYTETQLKVMSDIELTENANLIYNRINTNLDKLTSYGLTTETQAGFMIDITAYENAIPQPRQTQMAKKENTMLLAQAFDRSDAAVSKIDTIVEIVRLSEPTFYAGYKNARKIVENGTGTLQVQGVITDAATKLQIEDATVTFYQQGQTEPVLVKQTAAKGGFQIKSLDEGIYTVSVSKIGYQSETMNVTVSFTELCDVDVSLERL